MEVFIAGKGFHAFVTGVPETCPHKEEDDVFITASGRVIHWYTFKQWAGFTRTARNWHIQKHLKDIGDPITEASTECRRCKRIFRPPQF